MTLHHLPGPLAARSARGGLQKTATTSGLGSWTWAKCSPQRSGMVLKVPHAVVIKQWLRLARLPMAGPSRPTSALRS